jgi:succinoglycan biosynthesis protein ExoA
MGKASQTTKSPSLRASVVNLSASPGPARQQFPLVSALIATRDEAASIEGCLDALAAQSYPADRLEIIVIDGRSADGTAARAAAWSQARARPVRLIDNPRRNTPAAFNLGVGAAAGAVVILLGARARPHPRFVEASVAALQRTGADAVGGVVRTVGGNAGLMARAIGLAQRSPFGVGDARYRYATTECEVDTINYGAYRREVFNRIGLFDESMRYVEDDEFNYRLRAAGGRLVLDPAIRVAYLARPSLGGLWRQRYQWGRHKPRVARRHPGQMRPRHAVPALFDAALLAGLALWPAGGRWRHILQGTLAAYGLATVGATLRLGARRRWPRETALLPPAFATMHVAYGLGTLHGLVEMIMGRGWPPLPLARARGGRWFSCPGGPPAAHESLRGEESGREGRMRS